MSDSTAKPPAYNSVVENINSDASQNTGNRIETINSGRQMEVVQNVAPPPQEQVTPLGLLRERPENVFCPHQGRIVKTRPESKDSEKTWFAVIGLALVCVCIACIPLKGCCGDGMLQDWDQYCEGCGKQLTHRPYNREAQVLAPDHDVRNGGGQGWQGGPQSMQPGQQMAYMPQQQQKQQ